MRFRPEGNVGFHCSSTPSDSPSDAGDPAPFPHVDSGEEDEDGPKNTDGWLNSHQCPCLSRAFL